MERARQAELRRQLDIVAKATLVNSVKVKSSVRFSLEENISFRNHDDALDIQVVLISMDNHRIYHNHNIAQEVPVNIKD